MFEGERREPGFSASPWSALNIGYAFDKMNVEYDFTPGVSTPDGPFFREIFNSSDGYYGEDLYYNNDGPQLGMYENFRYVYTDVASLVSYQALNIKYETAGDFLATKGAKMSYDYSNGVATINELNFSEAMADANLDFGHGDVTITPSLIGPLARWDTITTTDVPWHLVVKNTDGAYTDKGYRWDKLYVSVYRPGGIRKWQLMAIEEV